MWLVLSECSVSIGSIVQLPIVLERFPKLVEKKTRREGSNPTTSILEENMEGYGEFILNIYCSRIASIVIF